MMKNINVSDFELLNANSNGMHKITTLTGYPHDKNSSFEF